MKLSALKITIALICTSLLVGIGLFLTRFNINIVKKTSTSATAVKPIEVNRSTKLSNPALTVSVVQPTLQTLVDSFFANGTVGSWQEASVSAEVSGLKLIDIQASVGDRVEKGQVLARFDNAILNAEIIAIKAQVAEAQANSDEAKNNAARARELAKQGFYSTQAVNQIMAQEKSALARLEAAKANLAIQQLRLDRTHLRAPDSGVITARTAAIGSVVPAGMELFRMNRLGRLEWKAELTSAELPLIQVGQTVKIEDNNTPASVVGTGVVRQIAPNLDPQTRNAVVYVDILPGSRLKVGQFVRGQFSGATKQALTIPSNSVVLRDGFNSVFVLKRDPNLSTTQAPPNNLYKVAHIKVETGQSNLNFVEIKSGLSASDQVVATGSAFLSDGDTVKVVKP